MVNVCPLCTKRVSEWQMSSGKTMVINSNIYHRECLTDVTIKQVVK